MCHIDENEYERLHLLFSNLPIPDSGTIVWDKKKSHAGKKRGSPLSMSMFLWRTWSEYSVFMRPAKYPHNSREGTKPTIREHGGVNKQVRREFGNWIKNRKDFTGGERAYQLIDDNGNVFQSVAMGAPEPRTDPKFSYSTHSSCHQEAVPSSEQWLVACSRNTATAYSEKRNHLWERRKPSSPEEKCF